MEGLYVSYYPYFFYFCIFIHWLPLWPCSVVVFFHRGKSIIENEKCYGKLILFRQIINNYLYTVTWCIRHIIHAGIYSWELFANTLIGSHVTQRVLGRLTSNLTYHLLYLCHHISIYDVFRVVMNLGGLFNNDCSSSYMRCSCEIISYSYKASLFYFLGKHFQIID